MYQVALWSIDTATSSPHLLLQESHFTHATPLLPIYAEL